jgi:hypothetical protein
LWSLVVKRSDEYTEYYTEGRFEMENEKEKFKILLKYIIEHEVEHASELNELAEKAQELGETEINKAILRGIEQMNKAIENFKLALEVSQGGNL